MDDAADLQDELHYGLPCSLAIRGATDLMSAPGSRPSLAARLYGLDVARVQGDVPTFTGGRTVSHR
jgi:hypothetical protein